jgi:hypothetical protein
MCIDYRKLNKATKKDHFPLPFIDEMLERLAKHSFFCFLDGYSGHHQILIHPDDQSETTFTCPYGSYTYRWMSFGLCNAPASFQWCMMSIFSEMIEKNHGGVHGWLYCLWQNLWWLFREFRQSLTMVWRKALSPGLGKMPLCGSGRNSARTQGVRTGDRSG